MLELDDPFPVLQASVLDEARETRVPAGPFFPGYTIKLTNGETHELVITATAEQRSYEYELAVVYQTGKEIQELVVNSAGHPFRVSGMACTGSHIASYQAAYQLQGDFRVTPVANPGQFEISSRC